ncbi:hypothetical protein J2Z83_000538 [Virgibacillus natechei]|uniref:YfhD family protein n=1 Tax=Virgibacillus natechei TaxID=1216297 RepID=A0ABS4IBX8_9BACI|nr:hypothetical protein [Virgibacillus natechei]MBP1968446.1 hypothetical protein [Virgibacillus natechei]UZD13567.1 hypothetical protein OLD84_03145 [Virgibacillus natechei]
MSTNDKKSLKNQKDRIEERTKLDKFKEQELVDDIPMEDLKIEQKDEKKKFKSKNASQSERKHQTMKGDK